MDEISFRTWLSCSGQNKKVQCDTVSRLKTLQHELGSCDLDDEYSRDACNTLFAALENKGQNDIMRSYGSVKLPIGKYTLSTYRYALNLYVRFRKEQTGS